MTVPKTMYPGKRDSVFAQILLILYFVPSTGVEVQNYVVFFTVVQVLWIGTVHTFFFVCFLRCPLWTLPLLLLLLLCQLKFQDQFIRYTVNFTFK